MIADFRIRSGIFYVLQKASLDGHMYLPKEILMMEGTKLLGVSADDIEHHLMDLCIDKKVYIKQIEEEIRVYAAQNYFMEMNVARMLDDLNVNYDVDEEKLENKISEIEKQDGIVLDEMQHKAVIEAVEKGSSYNNRWTRNRKNYNNRNYNTLF